MTGLEQLWTPAQLAEWLQVERDYVYLHAVELGALRLGSGPRARLRFDPAEVRRRLNACYPGRESDEAETAALKPRKGPRRQRPLGTSVPLLPIRGPIQAGDGPEVA
jgi:hypothetical protein